MDVNNSFPYAGLGLLALIVVNVVILFLWKLMLVAKRRVAWGGDVEGGNAIANNAAPEENYECPICLDVKRELVYSSCSHVFCENCIISHWRATTHPRKCDCPLCRRQITTIFPFNREVSPDVAEYNGQNVISDESACLNSFLTNFRDTIYESPLLFRSLLSFVSSSRNGQTSASIIALAFTSLRWIPYSIGCIIYILLPGDFFSEARFGYLGYLDDGVAFYILLLIILSVYRTTILTVHRRNQ